MATSCVSRKRVRCRRQLAINSPLGIEIPSSLRDPSESVLTSNQLISLNNLNGAQNVALKFMHDHEQFASAWSNNKLHPETRRWMRKLVQIQTINAIYNGFYRLADGTKILLDKKKMRRAAQHTRQYANEHHYNRARLGHTNEQMTNILVVNGDCLDVAVCLKRKYPQCRPAILNMAAARSPGGGWRNGAGAQEENLHRRTNMLQCLEDPYKELLEERNWLYNIPEFGGIYSPDVCIFRGAENNGYPFSPDGPQYMSFISCAAYSHPPTETSTNGELRLSGKHFIENVKAKIEAIFNISSENNHDILILSALGCGAYRNPPRHIAQLFQEVIEKKFSRSFKYIVFAIIDDHNAMKDHNPTGNVQPFAEVFRTNALTIDTIPDALQ